MKVNRSNNLSKGWLVAPLTGHGNAPFFGKISVKKYLF